MRNFITYNWFTITTILGLVLIALAKSYNQQRFNEFLEVLGNSKYLKIYAKERKTIDVFELLLYLSSCLALSVFCYFVYTTFFKPFTFEPLFLLKLFVFLAAFLFLKYVLERLIGMVFSISSMIKKYNFQKLTFINYSGLLLWVANVLLVFTAINSKPVIIVTLVLLVVINLLGFSVSLKYYQKAIKLNLFYFLLYLCALEIAPFVILYKVLKDINI